MLEALGFVVDFLDGIVEDLVEEGLDQPMMADDFEGALASCAGEADAAVALVIDERALGGGEFLNHVGDGGHGDVQAVGQFLAADTPGSAVSEGKDGLEVIIDGLGVGFRRAAPDHIFLFSTRD